MVNLFSWFGVSRHFFSFTREFKASKPIVENVFTNYPEKTLEATLLSLLQHFWNIIYKK